MKCRPGCGACCIAISIASPLPGMPNGKPAGTACVNLDLETFHCKIWQSPEYPDVCRNFTPSLEFCGKIREEALRNIERFERETVPDKN